MGFEVLGDNDSPVMPIMLYNPAKIQAFSWECRKQNVTVVTVAFPATPLLLARARICIYAAHSQEDKIKALEEAYANKLCEVNGLDTRIQVNAGQRMVVFVF